MKCLLVFVALAGLLLRSMALHDTLNFVLQPSQRACFYEDFDKTTPARTVEAFVQSGGKLDVTMTIHGPLELDDIRLENFEKVIVEEIIDSAKEALSETQTFSMDFKPKLPGTYGFCFDNRKTKLTSKKIQIDIRPLSRPEPEVLEEPTNGEDSLYLAHKSLKNIRKGIDKIMLQQQRDRHRLSLHSETNKMSHQHVLFDSTIETAVFIGVAIFQVFFVRRWFLSRQNLSGKQRA